MTYTNKLLIPITLQLVTISDNKVYYIIFITKAAKFDTFPTTVQNDWFT